MIAITIIHIKNIHCNNQGAEMGKKKTQQKPIDLNGTNISTGTTRGAKNRLVVSNEVWSRAKNEPKGSYDAPK